MKMLKLGRVSGALGLNATSSPVNSSSGATQALEQINSPSKQKDFFQGLIFFFVGYLIARTIIGSSLLSIPFAAAISYLPFYFSQLKKEKVRTDLALLWPELVDHIISGLRSGLSLAETLIQLGYRGPEQSRSIFLRCEVLLRNRGDFHRVFWEIKEGFKDPLADQVCEVLDFARTSGSSDITTTLRTLGDHIRGDIAIRSEIRAKHGWIKNSAVIATLAPWILLLILSAQPSTVHAFSTGTGIFVLGLGIAMSVLAFLWMGKVGKLEEVPRIFEQRAL